MKRIFALLILLATFAIAQTDSTDILITIRQDGDTTQVGRWRAGMPVVIRDSWDGWGSREKLPNKFVIIRSGISKAMIDSFLVAHTDSTTGLRRKYQLSRAAIQFVKNNRDANNIVRVTPAQLRNAFKRANRLRRFGEPQRMSIIPDRLYIRWRNMLIGATPTSATVNTDGGGDYTSLAAAEAGEQKDLETANEQLTISCSGTTADVTAIVFDGWTTDATRNIVVKGDSQYILSTTNTHAISSKVKYIKFYTLRIKTAGTVSNAFCIYVVDVVSSFLTVESCSLSSVGSSLKRGIHLEQVSASGTITANIVNNIFDGFTGTNFAAIRTYAASGNILVNAYNNTIYNCKNGILKTVVGGITTITANNNIFLSNGISGADGFNGTFAAGSDYNISDLAGDAPGANSLNSTTVNFADAANGDFRLLAGSPGINQGVDLSADPNYPFNTAIDGTLRPQGAAWDIGAFEYVQTPPTGTDKKSRFNGFGRGFNGGWKK